MSQVKLTTNGDSSALTNFATNISLKSQDNLLATRDSAEHTFGKGAQNQ